MLEQIMGPEPPGISTTKGIALGNSNGEPTFYATSANWTNGLSVRSKWEPRGADIPVCSFHVRLRLHDPLNQLFDSSSFVVQNSFDLNGNRTNIVYPGGLVVSCEYDEENRLKEVITNHANLTNPFSFNDNGASRLDSIAYPDGHHN